MRGLVTAAEVRSPSTSGATASRRSVITSDAKVGPSNRGESVEDTEDAEHEEVDEEQERQEHCDLRHEVRAEAKSDESHTAHDRHFGADLQ